MAQEQTMNNEEINEYMNALVKGKTLPAEGLEKEALAKFREISGEMIQSQNRVQELAAETEKVRALVMRYAGQREAYAQLLISAEMGRRKPSLVPPISLGDLRKKLGADKVEAISIEQHAAEVKDAPAPSEPD